MTIEDILCEAVARHVAEKIANGDRLPRTCSVYCEMNDPTSADIDVLLLDANFELLDMYEADPTSTPEEIYDALATAYENQRLDKLIDQAMRS